MYYGIAKKGHRLHFLEYKREENDTTNDLGFRSDYLFHCDFTQSAFVDCAGFF